MDVQNTHVLDELLRFYHTLDPDYTRNESMSENQLRDVYRVLLAKDRLRMVFDVNQTLLGYVESWRISFDQFGRLLCKHGRFDIAYEDVQHGPICYVANVTVDPLHRRGDVIRTLRDLYFQQNQDALYFVGEALRKKTQPVKVFKASDLKSPSRWNGSRQHALA